MGEFSQEGINNRSTDTGLEVSSYIQTKSFIENIRDYAVDKKIMLQNSYNWKECMIKRFEEDPLIVNPR